MIASADPPVVEGLLVLIQELNELLGESWDDKPISKTKSRVSTMIAKALRTAI